MNGGCAARAQMHFNPVFVFVIKSRMFKIVDIDIGVQLAFHPPQKIEIKRRRDAFGVVIGGLKDGAVLFQIDADQELR